MLERTKQEVRRLGAAVVDGENPFFEVQAMTLADLGVEYLKRHALPKKRSAKEDARKLKVDVMPTRGKFAADEITKTDIVRLVEFGPL